MAESFFASLETELIDRSSWRTRADARLAVFDYIEAFYTLGPGLLVTRRVREEVPFRRDRRLTYRRPSTEAGQLQAPVSLLMAFDTTSMGSRHHLSQGRTVRPLGDRSG